MEKVLYLILGVLGLLIISQIISTFHPSIEEIDFRHMQAQQLCGDREVETWEWDRYGLSNVKCDNTELIISQKK